MTSAPRTMRAIQITTPGPPSVLQIVNLPIPKPNPGQILIRIKAFGLNRSEILTRQFGRAPIGPVQLPRVLGVEATGLVEESPGSEEEFPPGSVVMTAVGGMGIAFDGGYAEYCCVNKSNVRVLSRGGQKVEKLGWSVLGALPEMLQTAHGCLFRSLKMKKGERVLVRGATTSVGFTALSLARNAGAGCVIATTRRKDEETEKLLKEYGADYVVVDDGTIAGKVRELFPEGVDKVLELVGGTTVADSLACLAKDGICCHVGLVGGSAAISEFSPLFMLREERYLTAYGERTFQAGNFPLDDLVQQIEDGELKIRVGKVFNMKEIVAAHECMERSEALGKIVVLTAI